MLAGIQFAVTDVETTGFFPDAYDRIVEIAVIRVDSGGNVLDEYTTLVNPQRDIGATHIHAISARDVKKAPLFGEIAGDVIARLAGAVFVAHNVHFDLRFVRNELSRAGCQIPSFPCLCTMRLARTVDADVPSRKLSELCNYFGIPYYDSHSAHGDALAAAGLLAFCIARLASADRLSVCDLGVQGWLPEQEAWPVVAASGKSYLRSEAARERACAVSYLARLVRKLPMTGDSVREVEGYLALLDRVLEDRRVTRDEADALLALARDAGLSRQQVVAVHRAYMRDLIRVAWEDGVITNAERNDLDEVRRLLGLENSEYVSLFQQVQEERAAGRSALRGTRADTTELYGKTICFTGSFTCRINAEPAQRSFAERVAVERGMRVKRTCTKKLDYLVAADPDSMSTKARKAREYGVRILAESVFWRLMHIDVE